MARMLTRERRAPFVRLPLLGCLLALSVAGGGGAVGQELGDARAIVQQAVNTELAADRTDHSLWHYRMREKQEDDSVYDVVDTAQGEVKQKIAMGGHPLSADQERVEAAKVKSFLSDPRAQAQQRKNGEHDDKSAEKLLNLLPRAFVWKVVGESGGEITLHFAPDPNFKAPDIESRVLGAMEGELVVDLAQHRIRTIRGMLAHDVEIGYGFLGKLRQGGTFDVERRQVAPGSWQITETHVHIDGRALLFKTIGQQTDEVKYDFQPVPMATTLPEAATMVALR
jgi:hypothetical protein